MEKKFLAICTPAGFLYIIDMSTLFSIILFFILSFNLDKAPEPAVRPSTAFHEVLTPATGRFDSLFHAFSAQKGFNGNVLISQHGTIVYEHSFGYADMKSKAPLTLESTFQLASVTKQFTATAILMLREEGKVNLTDSVQRFFPDFPYKGITIKELLAHRSGLPEYMNFAGHYWKNRHQMMSNHDVMQILIHDHPPRYSLPDKKYRYSNTGYVVLANIVEKASGIPFETFLEEHIFQYLGMTHTYVGTCPDSITAEYRTKGYKRNRRLVENDYLNGVVGDKGIYSTVHDLFLWDQSLYTDRLVHQTTLNEAFTPVSYDRRHATSYGYGWRIDRLEDGSKIVFHAGLWKGYNSLFVRRLSDTTAIIVLSNRINWSFRNIDHLMEILDSTGE